MRLNFTSIIVILLMFLSNTLQSQNKVNKHLKEHISGSFSLDSQIPFANEDIGAEQPDEKFLSNSFFDLNYNYGNFYAGIRFESYLNPMLGFDAQYKGIGIANRYAQYKRELFDVTIGNFYEQFGNGLIFRSYWEPALGLDNAMEGMRIKSNLLDKNLILKGIIGKHRYYWDYGEGFMYGLDAEFSISNYIKQLNSNDISLTLGVSAITKGEGVDSLQRDIYPEYVTAIASRMQLSYKRFSMEVEYAIKDKDPNSINKFINKNGNGTFFTISYSQKGLGVNLQAKRIENMSFKSQRVMTGEMLNINYLPALTKQHTYSFLAMYPYATQADGEMGIQADVIYTFKKNTLLGGKYGMDLKINYSRSNSINKEFINGSNEYKSKFFKVGNDLYFEDFNIEIGKRLSKELKGSLTYGYITFNPLIEGHGGNLHYNNVLIGDITYKINPKNIIRVEAEWLKSNSTYTNEDKRGGDWMMLLAEYNFSAKYFISLSDQYNYRGSKSHFYNISAGMNYGTSRIQATFGKQRDGIICIGGVCRAIPAFYGFMISLSSSF